MKKTALLLTITCVAYQGMAHALGVTPYLPLNLDPDIEYQVERVLILGDEPVMTRPIPAALVLDALPKACKVDRPLCESVRSYLSRYMQSTGVEFTSVSAAATSGKSDIVLPNQHGEKAQSPYQVAGAAYLQPNSYMLLNVGGVAYQGRATPTGTMFSLGFDWAQLDIGWRDHWWSPMTDSAMLISTEAPTMPSVTLSNYRPLTRLGLQYEVFVARMSESDRIQLPITGTSPIPELTRGYPKIGGFRVGIEPVSGWALSAQRMIIWGGGAAGGQSLSDILKAVFRPGQAQNAGTGGANSAIGKQEASVTSRFIFPGRVPFSVYFEYAGNDTLAGHSPLVGKADISAGIDFPRIGPFSLTYEISSFSPTWYVHTATNVQTGYPDGITNYGDSIGHWFGDQRVLATPNAIADQVGGQSNMLRIGWDPSFGGLMQLQLRALANESKTLFASYPYKNEYLESLSYSYPWKGYSVGAEVDAGRDVFGESYARVEGYLRDGDALLGGADGETAAFAGPRPDGDELYVSAGADYYRTLINLNLTAYPRYYTKSTIGPYVALGARRRVSTHQDLGVALEADDISGRTLLSVRMLDYRYRFDGPLAVNLFVGASRYPEGTPAYGAYAGGGLQWRNVLPGWDVGVDYRDVLYAERERDLPTDPEPLQTVKPDSVYSISSWTFSISRKF